MDRTTIMIPHPLKIKAMKAAESKGISFATLVRTALEIYCSNKNNTNNDLFFLDNNYYSGDIASDLSSHHDDYLYREV